MRNHASFLFIQMKEKTMVKISKLGLASSALLVSASGLSIVASVQRLQLLQRMIQ